MYRSFVKRLSRLGYVVFPQTEDVSGLNRALGEAEFVRRQFESAGYTSSDNFRLIHNRNEEKPGRDLRVLPVHKDSAKQSFFNSLISSEQADLGDKLVVVGIKPERLR